MRRGRGRKSSRREGKRKEERERKQGPRRG